MTRTILKLYKIIYLFCLAGLLEAPASTQPLCANEHCYEDCFTCPITGKNECRTVCITVYEPCNEEYRGVAYLYGGCEGFIKKGNAILISFEKLNHIISNGILKPLSVIPDSEDASLPNPYLSISDMKLTRMGFLASIEGGKEAIYVCDNLVIVDFGIRGIDGNVNGEVEEHLGETGKLTLQIPAGSEFLVTFIKDGTIKVGLDEFTKSNIHYTFIPIEGPYADNLLKIPTKGSAKFKLEISSDISDWEIKVEGDFSGILNTK